MVKTGGKTKIVSGKAVKRDWWLIKYQTGCASVDFGYVDLGRVTLPEKYLGKKVRFKIEILEEKKRSRDGNSVETGKVI